MQVYLDSAATTKPYQEVIDTMVDVMKNHWHNPSSVYADDSRHIIENVREQIAQDINADPSEIIFTSGACEANSLAYMVKSYMHIISSRLEHKSLENLNKYYNATFVNNDIMVLLIVMIWREAYNENSSIAVWFLFRARIQKLAQSRTLKQFQVLFTTIMEFFIQTQLSCLQNKELT
jgi:hypothetical protein